MAEDSSKPKYQILRIKEGSCRGAIQPQLSFFSFNNEVKPEENFKQLLNVYSSFSPVTKGIDITTDFTIQTFHIKGDNDAQVMEIERLVADLDILSLLHRVVKHLLIFGNAFVEVGKSKVGITELKLLSPIGMKIRRDKKGVLLDPAYVQGEGKDEIKFKETDIIHFAINKIAGSAFGRSFIRPMLQDISDYRKAINHMNCILQRYSAPMIHVKIGDMDKQIYPTQSDINNWSSDLEDIYANTEYVTGPEVEMSVVGFEGKIAEMNSFIKILMDQILIGLGVPRELLGLPEGSNKAQAGETVDAFDVRIKTLQRLIKQTVEDFIFKPHLLLTSPTEIKEALNDLNTEVDFPEMVWGEMQEEDEQLKIDSIIKLKNAGLLTISKAIDLIPEEFRDDTGKNELIQRQDDRDEIKKQNPFMNQTKKPNPFDKKEDFFFHICEKAGRDLEMPKDNRWVKEGIPLEVEYSKNLIEQLKHTFSYLKENLSRFTEGIKDPTGINEIDANIDELKTNLKGQKQIVNEAYFAGVTKASKDLGIKMSLNLTDYDATNFLDNKSNDLLIKASEEVRGNLKFQIRDGIAKGESNKQIAKRFNTVEETYKNRLQTIARTEVQQAVNEGRLNGYEESKIVERVQYLAAAGACPICAADDNKDYSINEARGLIPQHPNCRCTWSPVIKES